MVQCRALFIAQVSAAVLQKKKLRAFNVICKTSYKGLMSLGSLKWFEVETVEYSFLRNIPQRLHILKEEFNEFGN